MSAATPIEEAEATGSVRRGLAWSTVSNGMLRVGSFAIGIVLARLLTPEQFGVFAVALTVQSILMTLADLGLSADLIRSADHAERAPTVATVGLVCGFGLAGCMAVSSGVLASSMGSPDSATTIAVLAGTLVLSGLGVVPYATLQRRLDQRHLFLAATGDFVVSTSLTVLLVTGGHGVLSLAIGRLAGQSVSLVLMYRFTSSRPRFGWNQSVARSALWFGVPVATANLLSWVVITLDNVVIARVAGPIELGLYVLAFNISSWPMNLIGQVVRSIALPALSRSTDEQRHRDLVRGTGLAWACALLASSLLAVLATPVVLLVYGERWAAAAPVLAALALFGALRVVFDLMVSYLLSNGRSSTVLAIQAAWLIFLPGAMWWSVTRYGIEGGAWAHLVVAGGVVLPLYLVMVRRCGARLLPLLRVCVLPTLAALASAGAAVIAVSPLDSSLAALLVGGSVGCALYAALTARWFVSVVRGGREVTDTHSLVSVVVPCHNYADYVTEAVDSALGQEGVEVEVIVVDDASTDESLTVVRALAARDPRVHVVAHPLNRGPVETFNNGLASATGEFLVRLDADDVLTPGSLRRAVDVCRAHPEVGMVYGHPVHFFTERPSARTTPGRWTIWSGGDWVAEMCRTGLNVITSPEVLMRMSVVQRAGGQRALQHTHDMEMWMRLATLADVAYVHGVDQAWHREHDRSLSTTSEDQLGVLMLRERRAAFDELATPPSGISSDGMRLVLTARRTLALEALRRAIHEYERGRATGRPVDELVDFALETDSQVTDLPEWRRLHELAGTTSHPAWAACAAFRAGARRALRERGRQRRWARTGMYTPLRGASVAARHMSRGESSPSWTATPSGADRFGRLETVPASITPLAHAGRSGPEEGTR